MPSRPETDPHGLLLQPRVRLVWRLIAGVVALVLVWSMLTWVLLGQGAVPGGGPEAADGRWRIVWIALVCAALGAALAAILARGITRGIHRAATAARSLAAGDLDARARIDRDDELGLLGAELNRLAESLSARSARSADDRSQLLGILGGLSQGVVAVDADERVVHMNAMAARLLQARAREALGKPIWEVARSLQVSECLARALREGGEIADELVFDGHGEQQSIQVLAEPLLDGDGRTSGAVAVLQDVTRLRRLEAVRRDFVANVSHELKTPLTAIRGLVETLLDDPEMSQETRVRFLAKVRNQTQRLAALVTDLLTLSRVESGREALEKAPVDLRGPVRESVHSLMQEALARRLDVQMALPAQPLVVLGDAEALRQVMDNLIGNAIKYTPEGGRVWVRLDEDAGSARIEVQDTGIGIEPRDQERIFERFYRVDKARSRELGGTGLGLSIVKHITLAHRGEVAVESTPGQGSTFRVRIPLRPESS